MRIISGLARGRKLRTPKGEQIRPTADRAREALFSILSGLVREARFVDLFAGTGAVGLEALSRGATSCVFVDSTKMACSLTHDNGQLCGLSEQMTILKRDLRRDPNYLQKLDYPIDILFMDPPYKNGFSLPLFKYFDAHVDMFAKNGTLIIEEGEEVRLPEQGEHFHLHSLRQYGEAVFRIYKLGR